MTLGMDMARFLGLLAAAPAGPRIEIGVLSGRTLALIARHADVTYGVDSFEGMGDPTERDIVNGINNYPRGRLAVPIEAVRVNVPTAVLIKGFVPAVLKEVPDGPFAFAHLDVDHYEPTKAALAWLSTRMMPGGVLLCDDWFLDQPYLAAGAINEFAQSRPFTGTDGRKAWWVF